MGAPNPIGFEANIDWLRAGFLIQIRFENEESLAVINKVKEFLNKAV